MSRVLPILFNTEMVQAILDGRKTVTRRMIKPQPIDGHFSFVYHSRNIHIWTGSETIKPPYQPGDVLYVRETWAHIPCIECNMGSTFHIQCKENPVDYDDGNSIAEGCFIYRASYPYPQRICWKPSIHMPKEAARIWLKVTDVRVERLQEMKTENFLSEGIPGAEYDIETKNRFVKLWDSTLKESDLSRYGWNANPWVWVIEFEQEFEQRKKQEN